MSISTEEKERYFQETAIALRREGFRIKPSVGGRLGVWLDDHPICEVDQIGGITYRSDNIPTPEYVAAKDKAYKIVCTTAEYMRQMEQAPPLKASGLEDSYKVLADFNGTVLAGTHSKYGVQFVTWDWDYDRKGVCFGHYFNGNYDSAKQDFATRSRLISEQRIFKDEQLIEIYRCCADTLDAGFDLTYEQEKCIKSVQEQIENGMPDIMDRIREQDQHIPFQDNTFMLSFLVIEIYREIIKENIEYDILIQDPHMDKDRLDEIVDLILETVCTARKTLRIAGDDYPAELVKRKFLKLTSSHIEFVLDCMRENTTKIRNIKQYLRAVLFNAPSTIDSYYTALVAHDMASGAWAKPKGGIPDYTCNEGESL